MAPASFGASAPSRLNNMETPPRTLHSTRASGEERSAPANFGNASSLHASLIASSTALKESPSPSPFSISPRGSSFVDSSRSCLSNSADSSSCVFLGGGGGNLSNFSSTMDSDASSRNACVACSNCAIIKLKDCCDAFDSLSWSSAMAFFKSFTASRKSPACLREEYAVALRDKALAWKSAPPLLPILTARWQNSSASSHALFFK
mmetsp:Transcript_142/g.515  ORF Transcript_142/g.515 Transcript_142/m.515 type:complete len:205 (-) Transcript_142:973-1587(-)